MNRRTIRVADDNGRTQDNWRGMDGPPMNPEDWDGMHLVFGVTGRPSTGRPRLPEDELAASSIRSRRFREHSRQQELTPYAGRTSTAADWTRERIEREEALARVAIEKQRRR